MSLSASRGARRPLLLKLVALVGGIAVAALGITTALAPGSFSGYTASIKNSTNTAGTAPFFTCAGAAANDKANALFSYALNDASGSLIATDTSGNYRPGLYEGAMTTSTTSPLACSRDTGGAYVLNGTSSYLATSYFYATAPSTFSLEVWFKTTTNGGKLIGYGNLQTGASTEYDRQIYVSSTGQLIFGVYNGGEDIITSPLAYNDGKWHDVIITFSAATGSTMYVDGAQVAANSAYNAAENHTGYWRIGYDNLALWPDVTGSYYFTGSMRFAAVYTSVLSAAQVAYHYNAGR